MANAAGANNLVSDSVVLEFQTARGVSRGRDSNSGIGLRGRYEVQILEDYGKPPDMHSTARSIAALLPS